MDVNSSSGVYVTGPLGKETETTSILDDQTGTKLLEIVSAICSGFLWKKLWQKRNSRGTP